MEARVQNPALPLSAAKGPTIDRAWGTAIGSSLFVGLGVGPMLLFTFGVFVGPIIQSTGWSKEAVAAAIGPATFLSALAQPVAGFLADRYGMRRVAIFAAPLFAACVIMVGLVPQSATAFMILFVAPFVLGAGTTPPAFVQAISGWFERRRGVALALLFVGVSLGLAFLPPLAAALIKNWGWRSTYAIMGVLAFAGMYSTLFLLKDPPRPMPSIAGNPIVPGLTIREALLAGRFWALFIIFVIIAAAVTGGVVNFPVVLANRGVSPQQAAFVMTLIGIANLLGRVAMGIFLDRWFSPWATAAVQAAPLLACVVLAVDQSSITVLVCAALLGFGYGAESDALAYMASRAFGLRHLGAVYGLIFMAYGIGLAIGPATFGVMLQRGVEPAFLFLICAAAIGVAIVMLSCFRARHLPFGAIAATS
jgi:MFS family permease